MEGDVPHGCADAVRDTEEKAGDWDSLEYARRETEC